ncbi:c-type cytochrome [Tropicimonas sp. S265A]|uniref:c-type cytochrome n=1 Tax=Tropicimonas sp. S265A TaxID=3415134 RepID=UPI003C7B9A7B
MSKFPKTVLCAAVSVALGAGPSVAEQLGLGRPATEAEVAAWDLDVRPDGTGLPPGQGSVAEGEELFSANCAVCHGEFAEGVGNWPELAGGEDTLADADPVKTVGSYWPYLSTAWDYVHRSMPFGSAQTLTHDETYAIVAYILYSNFLVDDDFVLSHENFLEVEMPNADGFIVDDRAETEYPQWRTEPCMTDCKDSVEITMRAAVLDVTPQDAVARINREIAANAAGAAKSPEAEAPAETPTEAPVEVAMVAADPALVAAGETVFKKCKACHQVGDSAKNRVGPVLNGIVGSEAGLVDGFRYSKPLMDMAENGLVWDAENLRAFLAKPKEFMPRTKMSFAGLRSDEDLDAIIAYLSTYE